MSRCANHFTEQSGNFLFLACSHISNTYWPQKTLLTKKIMTEYLLCTHVLIDVTGNEKFKMVVAKLEVLILQLLCKTATKFQQQLSHFCGPAQQQQGMSEAPLVAASRTFNARRILCIFVGNLPYLYINFR